MTFKYIQHTSKRDLLLQAERFFRSLKNKVFKHVTAVSQNAYINKLDEIVVKYNNKCYGTIKMKLAGDKVDTYIRYGVAHNKIYPKFKTGDSIGISKNKNIFAKSTLEIGPRIYYLTILSL